MTFEIIATGSAGNAVTINDEILVDCGVPFAMLEPHYKKLRLVLLTHIHSDHFNPATIKRLHFLRPALRFACAPWLVFPLLKLGVSSDNIDQAVPGWYLRYDDDTQVRCEHIAHDVDNCCWHISIGAERAFYATDCGTLDGIEAKNYDLYMVEANHTRAEIATRLAEKEARGEYAYERRAAEVHLSHEQAMDWLAENMTQRSRYVLLHQHIEREVDNGVVRSPSDDGAAPQDAQAGTSAQG